MRAPRAGRTADRRCKYVVCDARHDEERGRAVAWRRATRSATFLGPKVGHHLRPRGVPLGAHLLQLEPHILQALRCQHQGLKHLARPRAVPPKRGCPVAASGGVGPPAGNDAVVEIRGVRPVAGRDADVLRERLKSPASPRLHNAAAWGGGEQAALRLVLQWPQRHALREHGRRIYGVHGTGCHDSNRGLQHPCKNLVSIDTVYMYLPYDETAAWPASPSGGCRRTSSPGTSTAVTDLVSFSWQQYSLRSHA